MNIQCPYDDESGFLVTAGPTCVCLSFCSAVITGEGRARVDQVGGVDFIG